jgi:hypothetical protein
MRSEMKNLPIKPKIKQKVLPLTSRVRKDMSNGSKVMDPLSQRGVQQEAAAAGRATAATRTEVFPNPRKAPPPKRRLHHQPSTPAYIAMEAALAAATP